MLKCNYQHLNFDIKVPKSGATVLTLAHQMLVTLQQEMVRYKPVVSRCNVDIKAQHVRWGPLDLDILTPVLRDWQEITKISCSWVTVTQVVFLIWWGAWPLLLVRVQQPPWWHLVARHSVDMCQVAVLTLSEVETGMQWSFRISLKDQVLELVMYGLLKINLKLIN